MLTFLLLIFFWPIALFFIVNLVFLPFQFAFYSIFNIFTVPFQLVKIAFNKRLRANHALEHATINVIEEHLGCLNLAGLGQENGFVIQGPVDAYTVEKAARIGLSRLLGGEKNLALHKRCGTSMLAANFISSVLVLYLLWSFGYLGFFYVVPALLAAQFFGPYLGRFFQKYVTTSLDVQGIEIVGVETTALPQRFFFSFSPLQRRFFVHTRKLRFY